LLPKPLETNDDSTSTDNPSDISDDEEDNEKIQAKETPTALKTPPRSKQQQQKTGSVKETKNSIDEISKKNTWISSHEGEQTFIVMQRVHSMFLNCIPATREDLGQDILAKIRSSVRNTLFKSAKFYPKPSHADKVVGICLYDCNFCLPGMQGDFARARH